MIFLAIAIAAAMAYGSRQVAKPANAFASAYAARHGIEGGKADYRDPGNDYRQMVGPDAPARTEKPGRYAAGYWAYQARYGWPTMRRDLHKGWLHGKKIHDEWLAERASEKPPTPWEAWRAGNAAAKPPAPPVVPPKPAGPAAAPPDPADKDAVPRPAGPASSGPPGPAPQPPAAPTLNGAVLGAPTAAPASGPATGPAAAAGHGIGLYRSYCRQVTADATRRIEAEQAAIAEADVTLAAHERVAAQLAAYKIGPQTAGGMVELVDAAKARKAAAQTAMAAAERARAAADMNLQRLNVGGHDHTAATVQAMAEPPAPVAFYLQ